MVFPRCLILIFGVFIKKEKFNEMDKDIYKKYLGEGYDYNKEPSIYIANHVSWVEIVYMGTTGGGFISKEEMKNVPIVGYIVTAINGLFLSRESKNSREEVLLSIEKRQKDYLNKENSTPLIIYPEGTITNGKYLLPFKRGAFKTCLPVKPFLTLVDIENQPNLSQANLPSPLHILYFSSFLYHRYSVKELPTIYLSDYAKKNYKKTSDEEDYVTLMNISYNIMKECGNFIESDKTLKDFQEFTNLIPFGDKDKNIDSAGKNKIKKE